MEKQGWKAVAIVFFCLFIIETFGMVWFFDMAYEEIEKEGKCLYDICEEYPQAYYELDVCSCYGYDENNELILEKTKTMYD